MLIALDEEQREEFALDEKRRKELLQREIL